MKNINENNLKTCIFLKADEFFKICKELEIRFDIEFDTIIFNSINEYDALEMLSQYFGVKKITSVHTDGYEFDLGFWLVYQD